MDDISHYFEDLGLDSSLTINFPVTGGHMSYNKTIYINDSEKIFVKQFLQTTDLTKIQSQHAVEYLKKEYSIINQLSSIDTVPEYAEMIQNSLILPAYLEDLGWHWRVPEDIELRTKYIDSILSALTDKESLQINFDSSVITPSQQTLEQNGWQKLMNTPSLNSKIEKLLEKYKKDLHPETLSAGKDLLRNINGLMKKYEPSRANQLTAFCHHDARQHNIAWHPDLGVRIVDWSWAGMGLPNTDTTMFLIDLTKSEIDVSEYLDQYFNSIHAHVLIGYWLARSLEQPNRFNPEVRLHQLASALTAYNMLTKFA